MSATAVRERPILFSGPMVKAILAGTKTQTRRIVTPEPHAGVRYRPGGGAVEDGHGRPINPRYGIPGDRLWVRETWRSRTRDLVAYKADGQAGAWMGDGGGGRIWIRHGWLVGYTAPEQTGHWMGEKKYGDCWRPSIHMPRDYSRLTLEITDVRVQRLQEISEEDIAAEGVVPVCERTPCSCSADIFRPRWDAIYGERAPWASNPWVWAITFRRAS